MRGGRHLHRQFASPRPISSIRGSLSDATFNFTEKALIALRHGAADHRRRDRPVGRRDHRACLDHDGHGAQVGVGTPGWCAIGIGVGLVCGAFNGLLVTGLGLPSIVVTIGTMSLFRGIAYIILGDQAYKGYPDELRLLRPGLCLVGVLVRARAVPRRWRSLFCSCCTARASAAASLPSATIRVAARFSGVRGRPRSSSSCSA